jgi:hypothetical protein
VGMRAKTMLDARIADDVPLTLAPGFVSAAGSLTRRSRRRAQGNGR